VWNNVTKAVDWSCVARGVEKGRRQGLLFAGLGVFKA
jgi:hypothetical protein